jgi:hypothetical protein
VIDRVKDILDRSAISYALVGGMALAVRGYPRFTLDLDLFTVDKRVLNEAMWRELSAAGIPVDVRPGDYDDPLGGVVRIGAKPEAIDIVVGRRKWEQRVIDRAELLEVGEVTLPVPTTSDLILLKIAAGGPIDQQDVIQLLAVGPRDQLIAEVESKIADLPSDAQQLWQQLMASTS